MSVFNGLSAADFLSTADEKVAYSKAITRGHMTRSKIKPFISTPDSETMSVVRAVKKTCELGSVVGIELEDELVEAGAVGNVDFNASAEELKSIKQFVRVDRFQHHVPSSEDIINQRRSVKFKNRSKTALTNWATRRFDKIFFHQASADCTSIVVCGHSDDADTTNLVKADVLTTADVEEAKARALQGLNHEGALVNPPLLPIHTQQNENMGYYDELPFFVMFVGTNSARHIKTDENWEAARQYALERGKDNPIFTGALGFWDGVLLLDVGTDSPREAGVLTSSTEFYGFGNVKSSDLSVYEGGAGQETEINLLMGAHAMHLVVDQGIAYYDYPDKDDPRRMHAGIDRVLGFTKTKYQASANDGILEGSIFDNKDYGVIAVVASTGK
jgi:N4-gp56 family major capsid protein